MMWNIKIMKLYIIDTFYFFDRSYSCCLQLHNCQIYIYILISKKMQNKQNYNIFIGSSLGFKDNYRRSFLFG